MDSDKYSTAMLYGIALASCFWFFAMLMFAFGAFDLGRYVGKLEAAAPELAAEKEADSEKQN